MSDMELFKAAADVERIALIKANSVYAGFGRNHMIKIAREASVVMEKVAERIGINALSAELAKVEQRLQEQRKEEDRSIARTEAEA